MNLLSTSTTYSRADSDSSTIGSEIFAEIQDEMWSSIVALLVVVVVVVVVAVAVAVAVVVVVVVVVVAVGGGGGGGGGGGTFNTLSR